MALKKIYENPFVTAADIPDKFFCDRRKETDDIINLIDNGNNVVIKAERRVGKTALLHHVLRDERIKKNYKTFFVDIYKTENAKDFTTVLANALLKGNVSVPFRERLLSLASMFRIDLATDDLSGFVIPSIKLDKPPVENTRQSIDALFDLLESANENNRAVVVFDEFQQIHEYPEKRLDAQLRTRIQNLTNVKFIFSGSERRLLDHMFNTSTEPFYRSCTDFELLRIPKQSYTDFALKMFADYKKSIEAKDVSDLYDLFGGYTSYMNAVLNKAFMHTATGEKCGRETVIRSISECISGHDLDFHKLYFDLSQPSRSMLKGLAARGGTSSITSSAFTAPNNLTPSQAETATKTLAGTGMKDRFILKDPRTGRYTIDNKYFEIWLRNFSGQSISSQMDRARQMVQHDPKESLRKDFPATWAMTPEQNRQYEKYGYLKEPFTHEGITGEKTPYVVQRGLDGTPWALPVEDCLALMAGIDSITVKKGVQHRLTPEDKKALSEGRILEIENKRFQFDLKSRLIKKKYQPRMTKRHAPEQNNTQKR